MADLIFRLAGDPPLAFKAHDNGDGTFALTTFANGGAATPAGELHIGEVSSAAGVVEPTVTVTAAAYSVGHCVGGKITLPGAARVSGGVAILQSVFLIDKSNQKQPLSIYIFNADPSASTLTDRATPTFATADIPRIRRRVDIAAADYLTVTHGGTTFATAEIGAIARTIKVASGTTLYAAIVTTGTPTYATTDALVLSLGFLPVN